MENAEREALEKNLEVLRHYLIFDENSGREVVKDLEAAYDLRLNDEVNDRAAEIPHPFRAYFIEGQRDVVRAIKAAVEVALNPPNPEDLFPPDQDREEITNYDSATENLD